MNRSPVLRFPDPSIRSFAVDPKTKEIVIRLYVGDHVPAHTCDVLTAMFDLVAQLRRTQEFCERTIRTDDRIEAMRRRHIEVARTYQRLRYSGLKHRATIRALFVDPAFADLHASTADITAWVQMYTLGEGKP